VIGNQAAEHQDAYGKRQQGPDFVPLLLHGDAVLG